HGAAAWRSISAGYFSAMRIRLLRGRVFTKDDNAHAANVVIISRMMMRRYWPEIDANPIGEFMVIAKAVSREFDEQPRQIVGIVDDIREAGMNREPMLYVPAAQLPDGMTAYVNRLVPATWVVRVASDRVTKGEIGHQIEQISSLPLGRVRTMHEVVAASTA